MHFSFFFPWFFLALWKLTNGNPKRMQVLFNLALNSPDLAMI